MLVQPPPLSVSQLNRQIKHFLEKEVGLVHVEGEVSNVSKAFSGHLYFTLKDDSAQIRCVFFKNRHLDPLGGKLNNGQLCLASGKLSLYEARGDYQLIVEHLTEAGTGKLYQQFEQLKTKLAAEGLFLPSRKKFLPKIPQTIGIITSAHGAAIHDILSTLARRFPLAKILIYPSEVQGATASLQLIKALQAAEVDAGCEVLILARGGGSLEDLWAFNEEALARQIAACTIPIISGVGHETDFTIADFVADYRAETPTAAAIAAAPDQLKLLDMLTLLLSRLHLATKRMTQGYGLQLKHLMSNLSSPQGAIHLYGQKIDSLEKQATHHLIHLLQQRKSSFHLFNRQLQTHSPKTQIEQGKNVLHQRLCQLNQALQKKMDHLKYQLQSTISTLDAVSPLATLQRGYAIASKEKQVLFKVEQVCLGDSIDLRLAQGNLTCEVIQIQQTPSL